MESKFRKYLTESTDDELTKEEEKGLNDIMKQFGFHKGYRESGTAYSLTFEKNSSKERHKVTIEKNPKGNNTQYILTNEKTTSLEYNNNDENYGMKLLKFIKDSVV